MTTSSTNSCRGGGAYSEQITFYSSANPYGTAFYRIWIDNHQTRSWEGPSQWMRTTTGMVTAGPAMFGRRGTFSFYAEYAQALNGRWEYGGEWVGRCLFT